MTVTSIFNLLASRLCSPVHPSPLPPGDLVTNNITLPSCRFQTVTQMVRVWRNECLRVFHDRLINEVDKQLVSMRNTVVCGNLTSSLSKTHGSGTGKMVQWALQPSLMIRVHPWGPGGGRRELTPGSYLLPSICAPKHK